MNFCKDSNLVEMIPVIFQLFYLHHFQNLKFFEVPRRSGAFSKSCICNWGFDFKWQQVLGALYCVSKDAGNNVCLQCNCFSNCLLGPIDY